MCLTSWHVSLLCYYVTLPHCDHDHVSGIFGSDSYKGQVVLLALSQDGSQDNLVTWENQP